MLTPVSFVAQRHATQARRRHATPSVRSFSAPWVLPGGALEVTITAAGYGGLGQVVETLPAGFSYQGSDLSEFAVAVEGQTIAFTLLADERFAYRVAAPSAEGAYSFSGILRDVNKAEEAVEGDFQHQGRPPSHANAGADGHADPRAFDRHSHRGAGAHPHVGSPLRLRPRNRREVRH